MYNAYCWITISLWARGEESEKLCWILHPSLTRCLKILCAWEWRTFIDSHNILQMSSCKTKQEREGKPCSQLTVRGAKIQEENSGHQQNHTNKAGSQLGAAGWTPSSWCPWGGTWGPSLARTGANWSPPAKLILRGPHATNQGQALPWLALRLGSVQEASSHVGMWEL